MKLFILALLVLGTVSAHKKPSSHEVSSREKVEELKLNPYKSHIDNFQSAFKNFLSTHELGDNSKKELERFFKQHEQVIKASRPTGRPTKDDKKAYDAAKHDLKKAFEEAEKQLKQLTKQVRELEQQKLIAAYKGHIEGFGLAVEKALGDEDLSFKNLEDLVNKLKYEHQNLLEGTRPTGRPGGRPFGRPGGRPSKHAKKTFKEAERALEVAYKNAQHKVKQLGEQLKKMEKQKMIAPYKIHIDSFEQAFEKVLARKDLTYKELERMLKKMKEEHKDLLEDTRPTGRPGGRPTKEGNNVFKAAEHLLNKSYDEAKYRLKAWRHQMAKLEKEQGKKHPHSKEHHH